MTFWRVKVMSDFFFCLQNMITPPILFPLWTRGARLKRGSLLMTIAEKTLQGLKLKGLTSLQALKLKGLPHYRWLKLQGLTSLYISFHHMCSVSLDRSKLPVKSITQSMDSITPVMISRKLHLWTNITSDTSWRCTSEWGRGWIYTCKDRTEYNHVHLTLGKECRK